MFICAVARGGVSGTSTVCGVSYVLGPVDKKVIADENVDAMVDVTASEMEKGLNEERRSVKVDAEVTEAPGWDVVTSVDLVECGNSGRE